jgi:Kef-type K+ transport system membrane component KefB
MSLASPAPRASTLRAALVYLAMLAGAVALFLLIRAYGEGLPAAPAADAATGLARRAPRNVHDLLHVLLALATILVGARLLGTAFRYVGQPPVIGEVVAGILLGPSLFGRIAPGVQEYLLPQSVAPYLSVLAQVGVILFMFLVGMELDASRLRRRTHAPVAISHASIVLPFVLGSALALWLYPILSSDDVPFTAFALFMGVSISVTAFPVLARILTDRGLQRTPLGVLALTCAAVDDVSAWCLLALVVGIVQASVSGAAQTVLLAAAYTAVVLLVARPLMLRLVSAAERRGRVTQGTMAALLLVLLLSAFATESIGIHAIFGAFLAGAIIPSDSLVAREIRERLEDLVVVLLLPVFFAFTGLRTQMGLLSSAEEWLICGVIILFACLGKFGGTLVAARLTGISWREGAALGILMNTRGLMELVVLNVGLDLGVISPKLFAMLVVMAVVTTLMTTPVLHLLMGRQEGMAESGEVEAAAGGGG